MRAIRKKDSASDSGRYYHLTNRASGRPDAILFDDADRGRGFESLLRLCQYYLLEPVSACWMGNHFHIVLYAPIESELPDPAEIAERHNAFHKNKPLRHIRPDNQEACLEAGRKMLDVSSFMKDLQQRYTSSYNRAHDCSGHLWGQRFKCVVLQLGDALRAAVKYIELNPVRAELVSNPADYPYCSWGWKSNTGKHPFENNFVEHMAAKGESGEKNVFDLFQNDLDKTIALERKLPDKEKKDGAGKTIRQDSMPIRFLSRTRHWTDGAIIGSKEFIGKVAVEMGVTEREIEKKRLAKGHLDEKTAIYCLRRLRD